jgi:CDP-glycerol glycerophosphotransferase (TagB/SpsB family)
MWRWSVNCSGAISRRSGFIERSVTGVTSLVLVTRIWVIRLIFYAARLLPVRERVVLATAHKAQIDGNLACISNELASRQPTPPVVVLAYAPQRGPLGLLRTAVREMRAAYLLATSRLFVVDDYFFPIYVIRPRPHTTIVQTWHACGPFKKFGYSLAGKSFGAPEALTRRVPIHSNYDIVLVASRPSAACLAEAFRLPLDRFVTDLGIPRTDVLIGEKRIAAGGEAVRERYAIPDGRRVVLYAPTFRGDSIGAARAPENLDLLELKEALGRDHVILLRQHPFVRATAVPPELADFVIDVSRHREVNELMLASDVLITDYSSVIFDFALLGRPILLFAPDHDAYERERGFYFDYRADGPGPVFQSTTPLARYLRAAQFDLDRVERFRAFWFEVADGNSTSRFVDRVVVKRLGNLTA